MKSILFSFFLILSGCIYGQQKDDMDLLIDEMCVYLEENKDYNTEDLFDHLGKKYISEYLSQFPEKEWEAKYESLYYRFQKQCELFRLMLDEMNPPQTDDWVRIDAEPESIVSEAELAVFKNAKQFYYNEHSAEEPTKVNVSGKYWIEFFPDNTTSKLYVRWITKYQFQLEFIKSDNTTRKNFSKKGDLYNYKVISREDNYYWVMASIPGQNDLLLFKLYLVE